MPERLQWYVVRLGLFGLPDDRVDQAVRDLRDELNHRPYLTNPSISWDSERPCVVFQGEEQGTSPEQASQLLVETLHDSTTAVFDKLEDLHIEVLEVKSRR